MQATAAPKVEINRQRAMKVVLAMNLKNSPWVRP